MKNPKALVGKTIARVDMNPFRSRPSEHYGTAHDPLITFTDGTSIVFIVEETEMGRYGVDILLRKAVRK